MKNRIVYVLIAMLAVVLAGCKDDGDYIPPCPVPGFYDISVFNVDGVDMLDPKCDTEVILNLEGENFKLSTTEIYVKSAQSHGYAVIKKIDNVEDGLYRPYYSIDLFFYEQLLPPSSGVYLSLIIDGKCYQLESRNPIGFYYDGELVSTKTRENHYRITTVN